MLKQYYLSCIFLLPLLSWAQNLVPNPGFEEVSSYNLSGITWDTQFDRPAVPASFCIQNGGDYYLTYNCTYTHNIFDWYTRGLTFQAVNMKGYYITETGDQIPTIYNRNEALYQPMEGDGGFSLPGVNIGAYKHVDSTVNQYYESFWYVDNTLINPLKAGEKYYVEFYAKYRTAVDSSVHDVYYPSELGLLFSDDLRAYTAEEQEAIRDTFRNRDHDYYFSKTRQIKRPASISSLPGKFYLENEWQRVCGFYTAKGGEKYLSIGDFNQDELWFYNENHGEVNVRNFATNPELLYNINGSLLIDNVRVEEYQEGMFFTEAEEGKVKICEDDLPYNLGLSSNYDSYNWQDSSTNKELTITNEGKYAVTVDAYGCLITDSVEVVFENSLEVGVIDTVLCPTEFPYIVTTTDTNSIRWSNGSQSQEAVYQTEGKQWLTVENSCGLFTDTFELRQIDTSVFKIPISQEILFCGEGGVDTTFMIPTYFDDITWQDNDTSRIKHFTDTTTFYTIELVNRCIDTTFHFSLQYYPEEVSLADTFSCEGVSLNFPISTNYTSYLWNTGDTTISIVPKTSGDYFLNVTNPCGTWSDTAEITYVPLYNKTIFDDSLTCTRGVLDPLTISVNSTYWDSIQWSTGSKEPYIIIEEEGMIFIETKNKCQLRNDTAYIRSCAPDLDYTVSIPNVISANGDGKNDCLEISYYNIDIDRLSIYSRYGNLIDEVESDHWCPEEVSSGTYFYSLTYLTPAKELEYLKGWLIIL